MAAHAEVLGAATFEYNPEGDKAQTKAGVKFATASSSSGLHVSQSKQYRPSCRLSVA